MNQLVTVNVGPGGQQVQLGPAQLTALAALGQLGGGAAAAAAAGQQQQQQAGGAVTVLPSQLAAIQAQLRVVQPGLQGERGGGVRSLNLSALTMSWPSWVD